MTEVTWQAQGHYPILALLQILPLLAALAMPWLRRAAFPVALAVGVGELLLALDLYRRFAGGQTGMQFAEHLPALGYHAAADGMTILFVLLTALLTLMVVLYGRVRPLEPQPRFLAVVFATQFTLMGAFTALNLLWFWFYTVLQLVVMGYLLGGWATSPHKNLALTRFWQFMSTGVLLLTGGILMLGWHHADAAGGQWSFDLLELLALETQTPMKAGLQSVVFFLLFYGLGIRIPIFPLHGWLPSTAEHGTVAVAPVFLLGLKTGVYGLLRFVLPLLPAAVEQWHHYVITFAVAGIFYAALLATMQTNLRRLLAYAVISHTGLVMIGLFTLDSVALQGSLLLAVNFGLAGAGLIFMTGLVFRRTRTTSLPALGGLFDAIPVIGVAFFIAGLSIVGMPGTPGFDAVHLVLESAIHHFGALVTIVAALGNVVAAGFLLWAFQRAFLAPNPVEGGDSVEKANHIEWLLAGMFIVVMLGAGFYSEPWLELVEGTAQQIGGCFEAVAPVTTEKLH